MANPSDGRPSAPDQTTHLASSAAAPALTDGLTENPLPAGTDQDLTVEQTMNLGTGARLKPAPGGETIRVGAPATQPVAIETSPPKQRPVEGLAIGQRFQNKYEIVRLLGVGGMGRVYEARHCELETSVAIKIMASSLSSNAEAVERFKREAKAMARVQHPNAVRVLDSGVEQGD
ncbi:MAG: protein kinase, partial [Chloracidobacterium sp.]